MSTKNQHIYLFGFLSVIILLLITILFQADIRSYFANRTRTQKALERATINNIFDVNLHIPRDCYADDDSDHTTSVQECVDIITSYSNSYAKRIERWESLIKENRDISCSDFVDKKDAQEFYEYINGEFAHAYNIYWRIVDDDPSQTTTLNRSGGAFVYLDALASKYDASQGDPYDLDTDRDFRACENLT